MLPAARAMPVPQGRTVSGAPSCALDRTRVSPALATVCVCPTGRVRARRGMRMPVATLRARQPTAWCVRVTGDAPTTAVRVTQATAVKGARTVAPPVIRMCCARATAYASVRLARANAKPDMSLRTATRVALVQSRCWHRARTSALARMTNHRIPLCAAVDRRRPPVTLRGSRAKRVRRAGQARLAVTRALEPAPSRLGVPACATRVTQDRPARSRAPE